MTELIKVNPGNNNNKYYRMYEEGDTLRVEYGRVGSNPQTRSYPISHSKTKYKEKIKKGYIDITNNRKSLKSEGKVLIGDSIRPIYETLTNASKIFTEENYQIDTGNVTKTMIDKTQSLLNDLVVISSINEFNEYLGKIFTMLPRKMKKVKDFIAINSTDFNNIITREQSTLDVMSTQVRNTEIIETDIDLSSHYGITIELVTKVEENMILRKLGNNSNQFHSAYKVINNNTQEKYNNYKSFNSRDELLWHGSRNENWWGILTEGLILRPTNAVITGKMFGLGTYFADKAQKSLGYSSMSGSYWTSGNDDYGILALYSVNIGNQLELGYSSSQLTKQRLQAQGKYDSVFAKKGQSLRNNEYIVYDEDQSTVSFIIKLKR